MRQKLAIKFDDVPADLADRHEIEPAGSDVLYVTQGNFTIAALRNRHGQVISLGVAKRNVMDEDSEEIGCRIAVSRALKNVRPLQELDKENRQ